MSLFTSSRFASAAASGTDWRDTSKAVLEKLEDVKAANHNFTLGFIYITDYLVDDAQSIVNLFSSVLGIKNWVGTVGLGVCGNGEEFIDTPAIAALVGDFDENAFCVFPAAGLDSHDTEEKLKPWLDGHDPMLLFVHGDPTDDEDPAQTLQKLYTLTDGFIVGGLSSSRSRHAQIANGEQKNGISGVIFSQETPVASMLSQGCTAIGPSHEITLCNEHTILKIDDKKAVEVFEEDLRSMVIKKIDKDPDTILIDAEALEDPEAIPAEFQNLIPGEIHFAFPVSESDSNDYLVRNIVDLDVNSGSMAVLHDVSNGGRVLFVQRNCESMREDLMKNLLALKTRVEKNTGCFEPKGALYVSCIARAFPEQKTFISGEMALIRDIIGDIPLAGFYAGGEICNARIYGYSGVLTLFL